MANTILVEKIEEGMIIAEPILNKFGQTLIPSGAVLTDNHKVILKTWNIKTVTVKSDDNEEEIEISDELRALASESIDKRMRWEPRNAIENNLVHIGIIHAAKKILNKGKDV